MSLSKPPTKTERRDAARAAALALRQKQEAADRRSRLVTLSVLGVVVVALLTVVVVLLVRNHQAEAAHRVDDLPLSEVAVVPAGARPDGGLAIGTDRVAGGPAAAAPEVAIYLDYH